ncbi:MAG: flippase-like domain-containing protein [Flavobacteriales bacterium]|nr:flippase-like domain-containing protein [Flavobacteriales bacterium]
MKKALVNFLKIAVPLGIGVWLVFKTYNDLSDAQKNELFAAFRLADMRWLILATIVGWLAHVSRGWRWRYLLSPLGHKPGFWNCYHAVMIGYFMNMFIQRAGEASRGVSLYRSEKVPFEQGFGTILAERVVDTAMLAFIGIITMLFQLDKIDLFKARIAQYREGQGPAEAGGFPWFTVILVVIGLVAVAGAYLVITRPALRARFMDLLRGFGQGLRAVLSTKQKGAFIGHTLFIWGSYLAMFKVGFYCLPTMVDVPFAGILAGFIMGAVGIVLVQGGIGVYPALVALTVGMYMAPSAGGELLRPDALAMGWLLWLAQTLMIIVLGGVSLLLTALQKPVA